MGRLKYWRGFIAALAAVIILGVVYYYGTVRKNRNTEQPLYSVVLTRITKMSGIRLWRESIRQRRISR